LAIIIAYAIGSKVGAYKKHKEWEEELPDLRKEAIMKSRAVLGGQFSEQLAPFLPDFKYLPTECKFLGKPVDFICFKGLDDKNVSEIVFVEVKSGKARLNPQEKTVKEAVEKKRVRWEEYKVPEEITKKRDEE
jgi:predicted Holliday junction resolvase-like endonuclease